MNMKLPSEKLYYSIGEVADMLRVNASLLRYWEKQFDALRPRTNAKGTRFYTQADIQTLREIYHLTKEKELSLAAAAKQLKLVQRDVSKEVEVLERLQAIRNELLDMKQAVSQLPYESDGSNP